MSNLINRKAVIGAISLFVIKYAPRVFHENLWGSNEDLLETRGRVVDADGNTVALPLKKVFNYLENGAGSDIPMSAKVRAIEKINGSMLHVTNTPHGILYGTTGSAVLGNAETDNEFLNRGRELFNKVIDKHFFKIVHCGSTFIFEVVDNENDPHIINDENGLYLLGIRDPNGVLVDHVKVARYAYLNNIYKGDFILKCPKCIEGSLGEILHLARTVEHEGFMVQLKGSTEFVFKLKSPYYLNKKRAQRIKASKLFAQNWREFFDDDYYATIDVIHCKFTEEDWNLLEESDRAKAFEDAYRELLGNN